MRRTTIAIFSLSAAVFAGCGGTTESGPKQELTEPEKQQVKDLNEQRSDEWKGTTKKK